MLIYIQEQLPLNSKMPGHIKLVKGVADPDPTEFLLPSIEMKRADQAKVYDTKKSVWIPDPKDGGYREGLLESGDLEDPASKCLVVVGHEKFTHKAAEVGKVNPPKFEKCEDMVNLTFLKGKVQSKFKLYTKLNYIKDNKTANIINVKIISRIFRKWISSQISTEFCSPTKPKLGWRIIRFSWQFGWPGGVSWLFGVFYINTGKCFGWITSYDPENTRTSWG